MQCPSCGNETPDRGKFCIECGTSLDKACPSCGADNLARAKFCAECGAAMTGGAGPAAPAPARVTDPASGRTPRAEPLTSPAAERRQLTVLFCDLVGSTALSGRLDPEDLRDVIRSYQQTAGAVIERYQGHIAQLLGDGLLVYFGYPQAHEDDAHRAGRAGLEIVDAVRSLNKRLAKNLDVKLAVRVGIHTGPVVVGAMGDRDRQENLAIGETPNVAARLQGVADPNQVVVSAGTARLVRGFFSWDDLGQFKLAGVGEAMRAYRLVRPIARTRLETVPVGELTPLVGRDATLATLANLWEESKEGEGRVVFIGGEAGIGKSRLIRALSDQLAHDPHTWLECRGSAYYGSSALRPLIEMAAGLFGIDDDDEPERKLDKLDTELAALGIHGDEAVPLLGALLAISVPPERYAPLELSPQMKKQKTVEVFLQIIATLAERQPLVFAVEDLHWLDPSTLEVVERLVERIPSSRMLGVFTSRPQFRPPWQPDIDIRLGQLKASDVERMVAHVTGGKPLPQAVIHNLIGKAAGNPLFIEELTKTMIESGQLVLHGDAYVLADDAPAWVIPTTLHDSLMARLDRLAGAKTVVQVGATIGQEFDFRLLLEVLPLGEQALRLQLAQLVDAELLYQRGEPPESTYVIKHALIQDAAYDSLLRKTRQKYHARVAEALEARGGETPPEVLARHYTAAAVAEKASEYWRLAGQNALGGWALPEAIEHLERGLSLVERIEEPAVRLIEELSTRGVLGVPLMLARGYGAAEVEANFARLLELCEEAGQSAAKQVFAALWGLWIFYHVQAMYPRAEEMGVRLEQLADQVDDSAVRLGALQALGATRWWRGKVAEAREHFERALEVYDPVQHGPLAFLFGQDARAFCLAQLVWIHWHDGDYERARERRQQALDHCEELGQYSSRGFVELLVAVYHCLMGEYDAAKQHAEMLIALSQVQGMPHWEACGHVVQGWAMRGQGEPERAAEIIRQGLDALGNIGTRTTSSFWYAALIEAELDRGQLDAASALWDEAEAFVADSDECYYQPELLRLAGEIALARGGDHRERAAELFRQALALARERGAQPLVERAERSLARR